MSYPPDADDHIPLNDDYDGNNGEGVEASPLMNGNGDAGKGVELEDEEEKDLIR